MQGPRLPPASLEHEEEGGSKAQTKPESAPQWEEPSDFYFFYFFNLMFLKNGRKGNNIGLNGIGETCETMGRPREQNS